MRKFLLFWLLLLVGCSLGNSLFSPSSDPYSTTTSPTGGAATSSMATTSTGGMTTTTTSFVDDAGGSTSSSSTSSSSSSSSTSSTSSTSGGPMLCPTMGAFMCDKNGVTPLVCDNTYHWAPSGGDCNFGCNFSTETCFCSSPSRYTLGSSSFTDTVTGLTYILINSAVSAAQAVCPAGSSLANLSQLKALLAQQGPATECPSPDVDPALFNVASYLGFMVSSPTLCGGGYTALDLNSGLSACFGTIGTTAFHFLCVN